jgi:hypothetical protein
MKLLDQENITLEDAGFQDDDSILAEIRSRYINPDVSALWHRRF